MYFNRASKNKHFAIIKLTENAVHQLVADYNYGERDEKMNFVVKFWMVNEDRVGITLLDTDNAKVLDIFVFNEKGPFMYL